MSEFKCPYCEATLQAEAEKCNSCDEPLPWVAEIAKLREEAKEREVNRGRATFTLIEEVFSAARGGRPVSVAALKGFAFAWLFPRTMVVIGSVVAGLVLVVQTVIIFQQTRLLRDQTIAAQFQQAEVIRQRVPYVEQILEDISNAYVGEPIGLVFRGTVQCITQDCEKSSLLAVMRGNSSEEQLYIKTLTARLYREWSHVVDSKVPTDDGWPDTSAYKRFVDTAYKTCGAARGVIRRGIDAFEAVARLHQPHTPSVDKPRFDIPPAPERLAAFMEVGTGGIAKMPEEITIGDFFEAAVANSKFITYGLLESRRTCETQLGRDLKAMEDISRVIDEQHPAMGAAAPPIGSTKWERDQARLKRAGVAAGER